MAAAPSTRRENIPLAILCIIASGAVFNCANAASKWLVGTYPVGEVLFSRGLIALISMAIFILPSTGLAVYRTSRLRAHGMRACSARRPSAPAYQRQRSMRFPKSILLC